MSSLEATYNDEYSVIRAQKLGDEYKSKSIQKEETKIQYFLSAKLCYSLITKTGNINEHPINTQQRGDIDKNKLSQLESFRIKHKIIINYEKQESCPRQVLSLLKSFYSPWLTEAKSKLKRRCKSHINIRHEAFIQVYQQMIDLYRCNNNHNQFKLHLQNIKREMLQQQHDYIDNEWKGPDFRHLQLKKVRGEYLDELTAVYDKKGYLKRCNNSQEDWLRKYHGEFLAKCISSAKRVFDANLKMKLHFGQLLLNKTVRFNSSRDTDLIPGGWIFGPSCDSLANALTQLLNISIKTIKQKGGNGRHKDRLRETLLTELDTKFEQVSRSPVITPPPRPPPPPNTNTNFNFHINNNNGNNTRRRPQCDTFYNQRQEFGMMNNSHNNDNAQQWKKKYDHLSLEHQQLKDELARMKQKLMMNQCRQSPVSHEATPGPSTTASTTSTSPSVYSIDTMPAQTSTSCNPNPASNQPPPPQFQPYSYSHPHVNTYQKANRYSNPVNITVPLPSTLPVAPMNVAHPHHHHHHHHVTMQPTVIVPQSSMEPSHSMRYVHHHHNRGYGGYKSSHGASRSVVSQRYSPYYNHSCDGNIDNNGYMRQEQIIEIPQVNEQVEASLYGAGIIPSTPYISDSMSISAESLMTNNGVIQSNQRRVHLNSLF